MSQCDALRKGTMPGSRRCTSAPSDRKSNSPSLRMFKPVLINMSSYFHFVVAQNLVPFALRLKNDFHHLTHRTVAARGLGHVVRNRLHFGPRVGGGECQPDAPHHHHIREVV